MLKNKTKDKNSLVYEKALIYCRVSSERQKNEGHGLEGQDYRCRSHAESKGYIVEKSFHDSFTGGGDFMNRPAMVNLLNHIDAKPHISYVVVFDDLKRLARDTVFYLKLKREFDSRGVKVECPNFTFENTDEGEFIETVLAAQGQLERKQNRRQVIQKQKARLESGYWTFYPPPGYYTCKYPQHGKLLVPDELKARIIREAFEGYAIGRFAEQTDVQRFLQEKDYMNGRRVYLYAVRRLLTRVIYAGYIEYEPWEVSRRLGHHEAIVPLDIFEKVQDKLNGHSQIRTRKDFSDTFPLRGFACCSKCLRGYTGSESTGNSGKKHPYYRCKNRGCSENTKSIKKDDLESVFYSKLSELSPSDKVINLAKAIVEDVQKKKRSELGMSTRQFDRELLNIDKEIETLVGQIVRSEKKSVIDIYESKIESLTEKKQLIEHNKIKVSNGPVDVGTAFGVVTEYLKKPAEIWACGDLDDKRRVLKLVFADKFIYDREKTVGTAKVSILYKVFEQFQSHRNQGVEMEGIEPSSI